MLREKIRLLFAVAPGTQKSDKKLLLAIWRSEGLKLSQLQEQQFMKCSSAESVTRVARQLRAAERVQNIESHKVRVRNVRTGEVRTEDPTGKDWQFSHHNI
jgi:hypothetical protein